MSFEEIGFRAEYRSLLVDIVQSFYLPLLSHSVLYQRAVGFFSSTALVKLSIGISELIKNGGRMQLLVSPYLQSDDLEAIRYGYDARDKVIEQAIMRQFQEPVTYFEVQRLNLLATLIAHNRLDIKVIFTQSSNDVGMYHEKMGLAYDSEGNIVAFTGSMNESQTAFVNNYESIDVFCSWTSDRERVMLKVAAFDTLWNDRDPSVRTLDFPKIAYEKLHSYQKEEVDFDIDQKEFSFRTSSRSMSNTVGPRIPEDVHLYDYQIEAIQSWKHRGYRGILDMATGTGKTYTGLAAITRLYEDLGGRLGVIIICPYQHLVEQWVNDITMFNMNPIIGYSKSHQKDWKKRLKHAVTAFNQKAIDHFSFVTTNVTFASRFVQDLIASIQDNIVLVVDEAHNFGAPKLREALRDNIPFRLALSATLERHMDQDGTRALYDYFGEKCIEYPLERAIREEKLTPYYYYPVPVYLTEAEWDEYRRLSKQIGKYMKRDDGSVTNATAKMLLIRRARLIAAAENKLHQLESVIREYQNERHLLVYCGVAVMDDPEIDDQEIKQIDAVVHLLGNRLDMRVAKFTATESPDEREQLIKEFTDGDHLQSLVAMRCLDEGVNIPAVHMAFMLASSTNPKEYIQRRGRVLRKAKGKTHAIIYDFITLPRPLDEVRNLSDEDLRYDISLVNREMERMKEFASIAENSSDADQLIRQIETSYRLNILGGPDDEFDEWQ